MIKKYFFVAVVQLIGLCGHGQNLPDSIAITVNTYVNDYNGGDTIYESTHLVIKHEGSKYKLGAKVIGKNKISQLLNAIVRDSRFDNTLSSFDIDSAWIKKNPNELLKLYSNKNDLEWNEQQIQFIHKQLTTVKYYQDELNRYLSSGCCYTMHQNYRTEHGIKIYSDGKLTNEVESRRRVYGFLLPWTDQSGTTHFTYEIESVLSDIMALRNERRPPMNGDKLLKYLVNQIVDYNMSTLYKLSAYSFQKEIDELKSDFDVKSFEEVYGRGRYIWNEPKVIKVELKNQFMKDNVSLKFMATVLKGKMYSRDSIKMEYSTIIKRVQSVKFIMDFLERNAQTDLDIYYFNNSGINEYNIESVNKNPESWAKHDKYVEGLKWYEKNSITPSFDVNEAIKVSRQNDCGCNFRFNKAFIAKAIFFELHHERSNSVWFLLPDDRVLLYILQGEKVLDFDYSEFGNMAGLQYPCVLFDLNGTRLEK